MARPRSGWNERASSYRSRLIGAGRSGKLTGTPMTPEQTERYWESGGDLRGGRSHVPTPSGAAPAQATAREGVGQGDEGTWSELTAWRRRSTARGGPPAWLKANETTFSTDTAAIMSQVDIPPSRWRSVQVRYLPDGTAVMTIQPKGRAYPRTVIFPDSTGPSEVMSALRKPGGLALTAAERRRLERQWAAEGIDVQAPIDSPGAKRKAS